MAGNYGINIAEAVKGYLPGGRMGAAAGQPRREPSPDELAEFMDFMRRNRQEAQGFDLRAGLANTTGGKIGAQAESLKRRRLEETLRQLGGQ